MKEYIPVNNTIKLSIPDILLQQHEILPFDYQFETNNDLLNYQFYLQNQLSICNEDKKTIKEIIK